jgi:hypothetical protein
LFLSSHGFIPLVVMGHRFIVYHEIGCLLKKMYSPAPILPTPRARATILMYHQPPRPEVAAPLRTYCPKTIRGMTLCM